MSHARRARSSIQFLALLVALAAVPGCAVVIVGGVAVAAGAVVAVNVTEKDTVRSEVKDIPADKVYAAALHVIETQGTVGNHNADGLRIEGDIGDDRVEIVVIPLESTVALQVKARTLGGVFPASDTARNTNRDILKELGIELPAGQTHEPAAEKTAEKTAEPAAEPAAEKN